MMNLLLIEDNIAEARLLEEMLKGAIRRFKFGHVKRLGEALQYLEEENCNIALLDLSLPDSQGLESLDILNQQVPHLPIVVLTNTTDEKVALKAVQHGAQDFLVKRQVQQEVLVRSLRYAIERKKSEEALREANEILEQRVQERTLALAQANQNLSKEIEERQKIQERLEFAQQAGKIGSFEWKISQGRLSWSKELETIYGLNPGQFSGRYEDWLQLVHPDDQVQTNEAHSRSAQQSQPLDVEFRIIDPQGGHRWIAAKGNLYGVPNRISQSMIGVHIDITDKKQLEAQFLRAQRLESLGTLASGISHDLNNILTPIFGVVQLLPLKFPERDAQTQQCLDILKNSAQRAADLVKKILAFARGVEGKRVGVSLHHLMIEIESMIQQTLPKSITIQSSIPTDLATVVADETQLHQVFINLCVNARDAMPDGGTLKIRAENRTVDEAYAKTHLDAKAGSYVFISVKDCGIGIAPNILPNIFDPFFTTKQIGVGTGLGLSAVLGIIKSHGGFIEVKSEIGQGSEFQVFLPATSSATTDLFQNRDVMDGKQELILVVDDEVSICVTTKATLEKHNYRVLTANSGQEAQKILEEYRDDIQGVVMDLMMPNYDGLATIPYLRQIKPDIPFIAMSGLSATEVVSQLNDLGFSHFLAKPFTTEELLNAIQDASRVATTLVGERG